MSEFTEIIETLKVEFSDRPDVEFEDVKIVDDNECCGVDMKNSPYSITIDEYRRVHTIDKGETGEGKTIFYDTYEQLVFILSALR